MQEFRKTCKELFLRENNYYQVIDKPVRINQTLFTKQKLSFDNSLLDLLYEKELGGEIINDIYYVTCYFENSVIVPL